MKFQDEVLALLKLRTERGEPRRNLKRLLRDHGGDGSAEELDAVFDSERYGSQKVADLAENLRIGQEAEAVAIESVMVAEVSTIFAQFNAKMKSQGKTHAELSELTGIPQSQISSWFRGKGNPRIEDVARLAKALGTSLVLEDDEGNEGLSGTT